MTMQGQPAPGDEREGAELRVHAAGSIGQVPAAEWDACANPARLPRTPQAHLHHHFKPEAGMSGAPRSSKNRSGKRL